MITSAPSSLDSVALARRLADLAGNERSIQLEFLLHLDEFDRRRAYVEAGYPSLWEYCLRALHLREGAAGRRIAAMKVLRRFPALAPALREGRLCLSTASLLGQVLTPENLDALVARAAYRTKAEVEEIVVAMRPRAVPSNGLRKLPSPAASAPVAPSLASGGDLLALCAGPAPRSPRCTLPPASVPVATSGPAEELPGPWPVAPPSSRPEIRPVAEDRWSMRVTLDAATRAELEELKTLLSHQIPDGNLEAVVREAIRCAVEKHGRRKGARAPARKTGPSRGRADGGITAEVRRAVWKRDGGRCTYVSPDGVRCGSRWQLELDHLQAVALGGTSRVEDLTLRCRPHNLLRAEQVFGRPFMDRFRRGPAVVEPGGR